MSLSLLKSELKRFFFRLINNIQKALLFDDFLSIQLRIQLLRMIGIKIGEKVKILANCDFLGNQIIIENNVFINRSCYFDTTDYIHISDNVSIGHGVTFITANHEINDVNRRCGAIKKKSIMIGSGCWIGANVTILSAHINNGCVISACSLVKHTIPSNTLVKDMGNTICQLNDPEDFYKEAENQEDFVQNCINSLRKSGSD